FGLALHQAQDFFPGEIVPAMEARVDRPQQFQVLERVQGPAIAAVVRGAAQRGQLEDLGMLIQIWRDMLPLVSFAGFAPGTIERVETENLGIESTRIGAGENIAGIVSVL